MTAKELFITCVKNTSAHAVPRIVRAESILIKVMWGLCFTLCSIYCVYSVVLSTQAFLKYPSHVKIELVQDKSPSEFPAVTFCNIKRIDKTKAKHHIEKIDAVLPVGNASPLVNTFVALFYLKSSIINENEDKNAALSRYGYDLNDMLLSCMFNFKSCSVEDFIVTYDSRYGNCFTFNSGKYSNGTRAKLKTVALQGAEHALAVEIFTGNPRTETRYEPNDGLIVFIQKQAESLQTLSGDRILVSNGAETDIKIKKSIIRKLSHPYGDCVEDTSVHSKRNAFYFNHLVRNTSYPYSQQLCNLLCIQKRINEKCGCLYVDIPSTADLEICASLEQISCIIEIMNSLEENNCEDDCPLPCEVTQFQISTSRATYPSEYYKGLLLLKDKKLNQSGMQIGDLDKAVLKINVYYESLIHTKTEEIPSITAEMFISSIGGTLGFYLGMSILTFIEFFELVSNLVLLGCKKFKKK